MEEHSLPVLSALIFLLYYEIGYFCNNFIYRKAANDVRELVLTFANLCKNGYNWKKEKCCKNSFKTSFFLLF